MRVTISDDLADEILQRMPTKALVEPTIERVLRKALPLVEEGGVALHRDDVAAIAEITQLPSIGDGKAMVLAVRQLHDIQIGRHRLKLEPAVLNELRSRAAREGKDFGVALQQAVDTIGRELVRLL